ncbi:hypothetical protein WS99_09760 [Burkholderia territorii]|nr:hypothetical protein WS99_09760 [Burkholderia territorii]
MSVAREGRAWECAAGFPHERENPAAWAAGFAAGFAAAAPARARRSALGARRAYLRSTITRSNVPPSAK